MFDPRLMHEYQKQAAGSAVASPVPTLGKVHQPQQISNAPSYHAPTQTATQTAPGARDPHPQNILSSSVKTTAPVAASAPKQQSQQESLPKASPAVNTVGGQQQVTALPPMQKSPLESIQASDPRLSNQGFHSFVGQNGVPKQYADEWRTYAQQNNIARDENWTNNYRRFILSKYEADQAQGASSSPVWQESRNLQQQRQQESAALSARSRELQQDMERLQKWKSGIDTTLNVVDWVPVVGQAARAGEGFGNAIGGNQSWGSAIGNAAWRVPLGVVEGLGAGALTKGYRAVRSGVPLATEFAPQIARVGQYGGRALGVAERAGTKAYNAATTAIQRGRNEVLSRYAGRQLTRGKMVEPTMRQFQRAVGGNAANTPRWLMQGANAGGGAIRNAWNKIPRWVKWTGGNVGIPLAITGAMNSMGGAGAGAAQQAAAAEAGGMGWNPLTAMMAGAGGGMFRPRTYGDEIREALASRKFY